jgi:hypothetical protein
LFRLDTVGVYALDLEYQRKEHKMTYGLPNSFVVGVARRISRAVTTKRYTRKSPMASVRKEWEREGFAILGAWLTELSYLGWWKRYKPQPEEIAQPEESPKDSVRFVDSED